jgi:hypothetical protein
MSADDSDSVEFRESLEMAIQKHIDKSELCAMPVIEDWVLVATFNDLDDDGNGKWLYMRGAKQAVHRTLGLFEIARDHLLAPDDD